MTDNLVRVNVGCGSSPTIGWHNFDNSLTVRLAMIPLLPTFLASIGTLDAQQRKFVRAVRTTGISWANAHSIPLPDSSADVVYSSHMIEHLEPVVEAPGFLREVSRVLKPDGVVRIVVPDLQARIERYLQTHDADEFVDSLYMSERPLRGLLPRIRFLMTGFRNHRWMYDAASLMRLVETHGFCDARALNAGQTTIADPGTLNLRERDGDSVYVEARRLRSQAG